MTLPSRPPAAVPVSRSSLSGARSQDRRRSRPTRISDEQMLHCIRAAFDAIGHPLTAVGYTRWRTSQVLIDQRDGMGRIIPSRFTIAARFGGWANACQKAAEACDL